MFYGDWIGDGFCNDRATRNIKCSASNGNQIIIKQVQFVNKNEQIDYQIFS